MANSVNFKYGSTTEGKTIEANDFVAINKGLAADAASGAEKFGSIYKGDKILGTTEADNLVLTSDITIAGGPLANNIAESGETWPASWTSGGEKFIPAGTSLQDIMMKLFCVEKYPTTTSFSAGSAKCTIAVPSFTLGNSGSTVEVGTKCTLSNVTISEAVPAANAYPKVTGFTYGYSAADDNTRDSSDTQIQSTIKTAAALNEGNYQLAIDYTGFNSATDESATANADYSKVSYAGKDLIATAGTNSVKATVTGPTASITYNDIPSYYACSNLKNTRSGANVGEGVFHKSEEKKNLTYTSGAATNNTTLSVTAKYKYFYGYSDIKSTDNVATFFDSAKVRALTVQSGWLETSGSKVLTAGESDGRSLVVAFPSTYVLSDAKYTDGSDMKANFNMSGTVSVACGANADYTTNYTVMVFPVDATAKVGFKDITIKKK